MVKPKNREEFTHRKDPETGQMRPVIITYRNSKEVMKHWLIPANVKRAKQLLIQREQKLYDEAKTEYHRLGELVKDSKDPKLRRAYTKAKKQYHLLGEHINDQKSNFKENVKKEQDE